MTVAVVVDLAVVVLLVVTIGYCAAVHRKLAVLRDAQADMRGQIDRFSAATAKAEGQIKTLKQAAETIQGSLGPKVDKARAQADDLDMLIHRGEKLVKRLDAVTDTAPAPVSSAAPAAAAPPDTDAEPAGRSQTEKELLKMFKGRQ